MCSDTGLVLREDSTESVDLHQESDKVSVRKKHLGLARWEMEECCKQRKSKLQNPEEETQMAWK